MGGTRIRRGVDGSTSLTAGSHGFGDARGGCGGLWGRDGAGAKLARLALLKSGGSPVRTDSTGSFVAAINHPGQAAGPKKWQALLEASSSWCKVTVKYKWGEEGMKR